MKILNKKAISLIEYAVLIVIIIGAFLVMQKYIQRGMQGNWEKTGQSFAYGRQFDPQKTIECSFDEQLNKWYDRNCYVYYINNPPSVCDKGTSSPCNGDINCQENVMIDCCMVGSNSSCQELNNGASP